MNEIRLALLGAFGQPLEQETEHNWTARDTAIKAFIDAIDSIPEDDVISLIDEFMPAILVSLGSLRSALISSTCSLVQALFKRLGNRMDSQAPSLLLQLLRLTNQSKKLVINYGYGCAEMLLENSTPSLILLERLCNVFLGGQNCQIGTPSVSCREKTIELMLVFFKVLVGLGSQETDEVMSAPVQYHHHTLTGWDFFEQSMAKALSDQGEKTRAVARDLFKLYRSSFPDRAQQLYETLESNVKKAIDGSISKTPAQRPSFKQLRIKQKVQQHETFEPAQNTTSEQRLESGNLAQVEAVLVELRDAPVETISPLSECLTRLMYEEQYCNLVSRLTPLLVKVIDRQGFLLHLLASQSQMDEFKRCVLDSGMSSDDVCIFISHNLISMPFTAFPQPSGQRLKPAEFNRIGSKYRLRILKNLLSFISWYLNLESRSEEWDALLGFIKDEVECRSVVTKVLRLLSVLKEDYKVELISVIKWYDAKMAYVVNEVLALCSDPTISEMFMELIEVSPALPDASEIQQPVNVESPENSKMASSFSAGTLETPITKPKTRSDTLLLTPLIRPLRSLENPSDKKPLMSPATPYSSLSTPNTAARRQSTNLQGRDPYRRLDKMLHLISERTGDMDSLFRKLNRMSVEYGQLVEIRSRMEDTEVENEFVNGRVFEERVDAIFKTLIDILSHVEAYLVLPTDYTNVESQQRFEAAEKVAMNCAIMLRDWIQTLPRLFEQHDRLSTLLVNCLNIMGAQWSTLALEGIDAPAGQQRFNLASSPVCFGVREVLESVLDVLPKASSVQIILKNLNSTNEMVVGTSYQCLAHVILHTERDIDVVTNLITAALVTEKASQLLPRHLNAKSVRVRKSVYDFLAAVCGARPGFEETVKGVIEPINFNILRALMEV